MFSAVGNFKFLHEVDQSVDALHGHGVVDAGTASAHQAVSLELGETGGFGIGDELGIQLIGGSPEDHVHAGTVSLGCGAGEEGAFVNEAVQFGSLGVVDFLDTGDTALFDEPVGNQLEHVDTEGGRSVEHGAFFDIGGVTQHGGHLGVIGAGSKIFTHDNESHSAGTQVLLGAGVDHAELAGVKLTGHDVAGHISNEGHTCGSKHRPD